MNRRGKRIPCWAANTRDQGILFNHIYSSRKPMFRLASILLVLAAILVGFTGCLLETETAIKPDLKIDPRLEGVWQITAKLPEEIRSERDEDDIGVRGYIIFAPLEIPGAGIDASTYKALAFDNFKRDDPSKFPEMFVSTRNHQGHDFLLVRLADHEKSKVKEGEMTFKNWVVDYEFGQKGELFLRFWSAEDFDELQKVHPMESAHVERPFAPITLKGDEDKLLDYYSDPKVRALLTSMGKYRKLQPSKE